MQTDDWNSTVTPEDERSAAELETLLLAIAEMRALCVPRLDTEARARLVERVAAALGRA